MFNALREPLVHSDPSDVPAAVGEDHKWGHRPGAQFGQPPSDDTTHILCDGDGDGFFEVSFEDDAATVLAMGETMVWNGNDTAGR